MEYTKEFKFIQELRKKLEVCIDWYNNDRIKRKLNNEPGKIPSSLFREYITLFFSI